MIFRKPSPESWRPSVAAKRAKKYGDFYRTRLQFPYAGRYPVWELEFPFELFDNGVRKKVEGQRVKIRNKRGAKGDFVIFRIFSNHKVDDSEERIKKFQEYLKRRFPQFNSQGRRPTWE
jgi:hypothetical protein